MDESLTIKHAFDELQVKRAEYGLSVTFEGEFGEGQICVTHENAKRLRDLLVKLYPSEKTE